MPPFALIDPLVSAACVAMTGAGLWAVRPRIASQMPWLVLGLVALGLAWYLPARPAEAARYGMAGICDVRRASMDATRDANRLAPELVEGVERAARSNATLDWLCQWE